MKLTNESIEKDPNPYVLKRKLTDSLDISDLMRKRRLMGSPKYIQFLELQNS